MRSIDPLRPGSRVPDHGPASEVTVLATAFNDMLDRLETERRDSARRALSVEEEQRRALAAELHDEVGQNLTALVLQLDRAAGQAPPELANVMRDARATADATLGGVRRVARRLRPEVLDELGLVPALTALCERFAERTRLRIVPQLSPGVPRLTADAELVVHRVAQESLTNVVRHAGAGQALVELRPTDLAGYAVELTVSDDGAGIPDALEHSSGGIRGMRERALLVRAALEPERRPEGGTRVRLLIPSAEAEPPLRDEADEGWGAMFEDRPRSNRPSPTGNPTSDDRCAEPSTLASSQRSRP